MKQKGVIGARSRSKKPQMIVSWDRNIICILKSDQEWRVSKGPLLPSKEVSSKFRCYGSDWEATSHLYNMSDMVQAEVRSVFKQAMNGNPYFPFTFLQSTGGGCKTLTVPCVSSSYEWTAQQISRLASGHSSIYIMALEELTLPNPMDSEVTIDTHGVYCGLELLCWCIGRIG